ncbi:hypothetical protein BU251_08505 [Candidatus Velamenicoccus archaeovorus]|uniref:Uncharacterized protein n=1 Tax=Velamenicoccus archaeovorus TaxID=1930593 RepID=A0A410P6E7_VELA1|nr:hypothetical protein BU251_08505 [Candidatus Velamenicoccus archaeovorus]
MGTEGQNRRSVVGRSRSRCEKFYIGKGPLSREFAHRMGPSVGPFCEAWFLDVCRLKRGLHFWFETRENC